MTPIPKVGLDDFLVSGGTIDELIAAVDQTLIGGHRIKIVDRGQDDIAQDVVKALLAANDPPALFVKSDGIVEVARDERGVTRLQPLDAMDLKEVMGRAATFVGRKQAETKPTLDDAAMVIRNREFRRALPAIERIVKAPILAGGIVETTPGYCAAAKVYLDCDKVQPWTKGATAAVDYLWQEVFKEFPFTCEADLAHTYACALLPIMRSAIDGPTPMHLFQARVPGSGKSLLAKTCMALTLGLVPSMIWSKDEEALSKFVASMLREGQSVLFFDNMRGRIQSETVESLLTSKEYSARVLGVSQTFTAPINQVIIGTANRVILNRDMIDRSVRILIDYGVDQPRDVPHARDLEEWVPENQAALAGALVAIVDAWLAAGSPMHTGLKMGSFPKWSKIMGGVLDVAGVPGFLGNMEAFRADVGSDDTSWREFYIRWQENFQAPTTAGNLLSIFQEDETLQALLGERCNVPGAKLADILKARIGIPVGGLMVELGSKSGTFKIVHADPRGVLGRALINDFTPGVQAGVNDGVVRI